MYSPAHGSDQPAFGGLLREARRARHLSQLDLPLCERNRLLHTAREGLEHPEVQAVLEEVLRYPDLSMKLRHIDLDASRLPVLPLHFRLGDRDLRLFTMLSSFGTPQDVTADELRVESFFPVDAGSEQLLRQLAGLQTTATY